MAATANPWRPPPAHGGHSLGCATALALGVALLAARIPALRIDPIQALRSG